MKYSFITGTLPLDSTGAEVDGIADCSEVTCVFTGVQGIAADYSGVTQPFFCGVIKEDAEVFRKVGYC